MKRITKKLCSTVCALLAFSGNRGGALTKEALHLTKEILCNAGQWLTCFLGLVEYLTAFYDNNEQGELVPEEHLTPGQKAFGYAFGVATVLNVVDAAERSYDIAHDVIKGSNNKPDTTNKKESKNYWPILEAIFGVTHFAFAFGHRPVIGGECKRKGGVCTGGLIAFVVGSASLADAYFRFRGSNQNEQSPIPEKNSDIKNVDNIKAQKSKNKQ